MQEATWQVFNWTNRAYELSALVLLCRFQLGISKWLENKRKASRGSPLILKITWLRTVWLLHFNESAQNNISPVMLSSSCRVSRRNINKTQRHNSESLIVENGKIVAALVGTFRYATNTKNKLFRTFKSLCKQIITAIRAENRENGFLLVPKVVSCDEKWNEAAERRKNLRQKKRFNRRLLCGC